MSGRQRRRAERRHRGAKRHAMVDVGGGMLVASPDAVLRAIASLPEDLDWAFASRGVLPTLPRRRPMPPTVGEPVRVMLPPGLPVGFGMDIGPAVLHVGETMLESWGIGAAELTAASLTNLRRLASRSRRKDLVRQAIEGVPARILQSGFGCASALVLVPDELQRIFGAEAQCLIAPMRDVLIAMPADADRELVAWINDELGEMDPNGLAVDAFLLEDGALRYEPLRRSSIA